MMTTDAPPGTHHSPPAQTPLERMAAGILARDPRVGTVAMQQWVWAHGDALTALEEAIGGPAIDRRYLAVKLLGLPCKPSTYYAYRTHQAAPEAVGGTVAPSDDVGAVPTPEPPSAPARPPPAMNGIIRRIDYATFRTLVRREYSRTHAKAYPHEAEIVALAVNEGLAFAHPDSCHKPGGRKGPHCPWSGLLRRLNLEAVDAGWPWHFEAIHALLDGVWSLAVAKAPGPGRQRTAKAGKRAA